MSRRRDLVRSHQWWGHKIPPVIGVAGISIGLGGVSGTDLRDLVLLLASMIGLAAFGHVVNDLSDIEVDRRGGKTNVMSDLPASRRTGLVAATLLVGFGPWLVLPVRAGALVALLVEFMLLVAYSVPPIRLKARSWLGALADASYAYAVPFALVHLLLGPDDESTQITASALLGAWGLVMGLRGILWHQIGDLEVDAAAGVNTAAVRFGSSRTQSLVASFLLPLEVVLGVGLAVIAGVAWLPLLLAAFVVWRCFQVSLLWAPPLGLTALRDGVDRVEVIGYTFINEFIERWLPVAALVAVAVNSPWWWAAVVAYLVVFPSAVRSFIAHDVWLIPDAVQRLVLSWGTRRDIQEIAQRRLARVSAGPESPPEPSGRFVFVVCGPLPHVLTLRTAIDHLRPVTQAEIWVITDSSRNARPIEGHGVDQIVDVATPVELDDHQASIWLKTSAHRHLPDGEWCYLDSDIIAAVPGVEGVFAQRRGIVAFASDVTIRENSVDRFSPWAMTCDCLGYGDEHSCSHLRQQLSKRFDLEVPGDWLHWNGGVFVFGTDSSAFLDLWHERAVASFAWPEWKTRDQGALISAVWTMGLQDLPRISPEFNFIADLGNHDLCLDPAKGWAHHPSGPWYDPKLLHLYTSPLEDPAWRLGPDVEAVVLRRSRVRVYRWERGEAAARMKEKALDSKNSVLKVSYNVGRRKDKLIDDGRRVVHWAQCFFDPRRLSPYRVRRAVRIRRGLDVSHLPLPLELQAKSRPKQES